mmetsp:Transcript_9199/g.24136  ORF Transcript_9199/g.24136 Transcript_9199/m.24136 type:complete len:242 (-) Transcript_9199:66-791(-)
MPIVYAEGCHDFVLEHRFKPPPELCYLEGYGYADLSVTDGHPVHESVNPEADGCYFGIRLEMEVATHLEMQEHTWYVLQCAFRPVDSNSERMVQWRPKRRLVHIRSMLHDFVKDELGSKYVLHFGEAPFAYRGGLSGTSERLSTWLAALAHCINTGAATHRLAARVMQFLEPPSLSGEPQELASSDYSEFARVCEAAIPGLEVASRASLAETGTTLARSASEVTRWWWLPFALHVPRSEAS